MTSAPPVSFTIQDFIGKWRDATLKERSASQSHFNDLCRAFGVPTPTEADPTGSFYTFERGAEKTSGGDGWADVWFRGHFAWEYKGQHAEPESRLPPAPAVPRGPGEPAAAGRLRPRPLRDPHQLHRHRNKVYAFALDDLDQPENLARPAEPLWTDPDAPPAGHNRRRPSRKRRPRASARWRPACKRRGVEPHRAAHFLVQLLFCLFAEDVGLLPKRAVHRPARALAYANRSDSRRGSTALLAAMRDGGDFGVERARPLQRRAVRRDRRVEPLTADELTHAGGGGRARLGQRRAGHLRHPLRALPRPGQARPARRPLHRPRRHRAGGRAGGDDAAAPALGRGPRAEALTARGKRPADARASADARRGDAAANRAAGVRRRALRLPGGAGAVRVLDPACGSGNFLYVALAGLHGPGKGGHRLRRGERAAGDATRGCGPAQLAGLEINEYARELAQVVVWIGYLQWMTANGFRVDRDPVLEPLETIRLQDALLDRSDPEHPKEASWPAADFIIGNPPFLGGKSCGRSSATTTSTTCSRVTQAACRANADLVCYFFEKARAADCGRATQARRTAGDQLDPRRREPRGAGADQADRRHLHRLGRRTVDSRRRGGPHLDRRLRRWSETVAMLDGRPVATINADLTALDRHHTARPLAENAGIAFIGDVKGGTFDVPGELARALACAAQPTQWPPQHRRIASVGQRLRHHCAATADMWIVDFGVDMPEHEAALYEAPFEHVTKHVKPERDKNRDEPVPRLVVASRRAAARRCAKHVAALSRYIVTPTVAKHRVFVWLTRETCCPTTTDCLRPRGRLLLRRAALAGPRGLVAADGDVAGGTTRATPRRPASRPSRCPGRRARSAGAIRACTPSPRRRGPGRPAPSLARTRRTPTEADLKKRTLTNLYNARPAWLAHAHAALDRAVWAAYGWDDPDPRETSEEEILSRLLALNQQRSETLIS